VINLMVTAAHLEHKSSDIDPECGMPRANNQTVSTQGLSLGVREGKSAIHVELHLNGLLTSILKRILESSMALQTGKE